MTLEVGANRMAPIDLAGDGAIQVAAGWAPGGEVVVLLRLGGLVFTLSVDGAQALALALAEEAMVAARLDHPQGHPT